MNYAILQKYAFCKSIMTLQYNMPKKYWFLLVTAGVLFAGNFWLSYTKNEKFDNEKRHLIIDDSTQYPKLEVSHLTMKPAWYQFFLPQIALPTPADKDAPIAFVMQENPNNSTLCNWFLINQSAQPQLLPTQNGSLLMIQEAQDSKGKWRPVEYWTEQWGNTNLPVVNDIYALEPTKALLLVAPKYKGKFETLFRFKLKMTNQKGKQSVLYSPTFKGSIAPSQFEVSPQDKKKKISYLD